MAGSSADQKRNKITRKGHFALTTFDMSLNSVLSPALREIRLLCCQTASTSAGTRSVLDGAS